MIGSKCSRKSLQSIVPVSRHLRNLYIKTLYEQVNLSCRSTTEAERTCEKNVLIMRYLYHGLVREGTGRAARLRASSSTIIPPFECFPDAGTADSFTCYRQAIFHETIKSNPTYADHVQAIEWSFLNFRPEDPPKHPCYEIPATIELFSRLTKVTRVTIRGNLLRDHLWINVPINVPLPSSLFPLGTSLFTHHPVDDISIIWWHSKKQPAQS